MFDFWYLVWLAFFTKMGKMVNYEISLFSLPSLAGGTAIRELIIPEFIILPPFLKKTKKYKKIKAFQFSDGIVKI